MLPYKEGTVAVTQGSAAVTGTDTYWHKCVAVGDKFSVDHSHFYIVVEVASDTQMTIDIPYPDESASEQSYLIVRDSSEWGMNALVSQQVTELMHLYKTRLVDAAGIKGEPGDSAVTDKGVWQLGVAYAERDLVRAANKSGATVFYCCLIAVQGNTPPKEDSEHWFSFQGLDGPAPAHKWSGTSLIILNPDGTDGGAVDLKGQKGDTGSSIFPTIQLPVLTASITLSESHAARRAIFNTPDACTVHLPSSGLPEGFHCMVRNAGGGQVSVVKDGNCIVENETLQWSDPAKYGGIMLDAVTPQYTYFLMGGFD